MKKLSLLSVFFLFNILSFAQRTSQQIIEDSVIGWTKLYHYKGANKTAGFDNRTYSIAQLSICDSFVNWIQASYVPKGGIGDVRKSIFPKSSVYAPYQIGLPNGYGATAYTWSVRWDDGKLKPIQETEIPWGIAANEVPGVALKMLSNASQYFFFLEGGNRFFENTPDAVKNKYDITSLPQFKNYITFHTTGSRYDRNAGVVDAVLLSPNHQMPFVRVTVKELLQKIEAMLPVIYEERKKKEVYDKYPGDQKSIDYFMKYENDRRDKAFSTLAKLKEKYKNNLEEQAAIPSAFDYFDFVNSTDIFTRSKIDEPGSKLQKFAVYTLAPNAYALGKLDKPQWILITWSWMTSSPSEVHMHESIINNFNFDYVYNFFFDPEKVKGKPYQPLHAPASREIITKTESSAIAKKTATEKNIHFFEDFSDNSIGKKPVGWSSRVNLMGGNAVIDYSGDEKIKWVVLKGNTIIPNNLRKPLPADFTLTYDVQVPRGFTWGGKGLDMIVAKEKSTGIQEAFIRFKVRPGFDGRPGSSELETKFPSGYSNESKYYELPAFSNNKPFNLVAVMIKKKGESLQVYIDSNVIATYKKAIPADLLFNSLTFSHVSSDSDTEKYYITNIKISKD